MGNCLSRPPRQATRQVARQQCIACWLCAALVLPLAFRPNALAESPLLQPLPPVTSIETATAFAAQPAAFYERFLAADGAGEGLTVEERLGLLEENYGQLQENYDKLQEANSALKDKMKVLATSGHGGATMKISGRIHLDHWAFPDDSAAVNIFENNDPAISPQDRIGFRRLRFGVGGKLRLSETAGIRSDFTFQNDFELLSIVYSRNF